jgi:hypothetical protein
MQRQFGSEISRKRRRFLLFFRKSILKYRSLAIGGIHVVEIVPVAGVPVVLNLFEAVRNNPSYNKLEIGDFLFAEYTCGVTARKLAKWTDTDYLVHVVTGAKTWHTLDGVWKASPGETLFFKKGAAIIEQHFEEDVCLLMFFIPDGFMRSTVREMAGGLSHKTSTDTPIKSALWVENDMALSAFFQSMRTYFSGREKLS